ncbi:MAG: type II secretion system F family protein [Desulfurococcaceae archaeon]|nr:type II secretion system F family protein [Desulfurococcaceae archaeon]
MLKNLTNSKYLKRLRIYISKTIEIASTPIKIVFRSYTSSVKDFDIYIIGSGISTSYDKYLENLSRIILVILITSSATLYTVLSRLVPPPISIVIAIAFSLLVVLPLSMGLAIYIPVVMYRNRGDVVESKAIELLKAFSLLVASGQTIHRVLEMIPKVLGRDYKFFSIEIDLAVSLIRVGVPIADVFRTVAKVTPSPTLRELFLSLSSIASIGGNIAQVIWSLTEMYVTRYSIRIERATDSLNIYMEIYVAAALLIPSLVGSIAALALIVPIMGISFEALLVLTTLIVVPIASIAIVVLADVIVSRVRP